MHKFHCWLCFTLTILLFAIELPAQDEGEHGTDHHFSLLVNGNISFWEEVLPCDIPTRSTRGEDGSGGKPLQIPLATEHLEAVQRRMLNYFTEDTIAKKSIQVVESVSDPEFPVSVRAIGLMLYPMLHGANYLVLENFSDTPERRTFIRRYFAPFFREISGLPPAEQSEPVATIQSLAGKHNSDVARRDSAGSVSKHRAIVLQYGSVQLVVHSSLYSSESGSALEEFSFDFNYPFLKTLQGEVRPDQYYVIRNLGEGVRVHTAAALSDTTHLTLKANRLPIIQHMDDSTLLLSKEWNEARGESQVTLSHREGVVNFEIGT